MSNEQNMGPNHNLKRTNQSIETVGVQIFGNDYNTKIAEKMSLKVV